MTSINSQTKSGKSNHSVQGGRVFTYSRCRFVGFSPRRTMIFKVLRKFGFFVGERFFLAARFLVFSVSRFFIYGKPRNQDFRLFIRIAPFARSGALQFAAFI